MFNMTITGLKFFYVLITIYNQLGLCYYYIREINRTTTLRRYEKWILKEKLPLLQAEAPE